MAQHKPGSWRVVKRSNQNGVRALYVTYDGGEARTWIPQRQVTSLAPLTERDESDAQLFAAAPDLLAALRNITECAEAGEDGANMDLWIEQARAAIAKAEGC